MDPVPTHYVDYGPNIGGRQMYIMRRFFWDRGPTGHSYRRSRPMLFITSDLQRAVDKMDQLNKEARNELEDQVPQ